MTTQPGVMAMDTGAGVAAELEQTAIELELLAVRLANAPGLASETIMCLQAFDELAQRQRELARLIRGDITVAALGLGRLQARLLAE